MARNLHRAGMLAGVWNRSPAKAAALATELGVSAYETPAALAADCAAIGVCVSADDDLREVVAGLRGGLAAGKTVIDFSTVGAATARELHAGLAAIGVGFLDCPVSGGVEGAKQATLAIMAGGEESVFRRALPVLQAVGRKIAYLGPSGAGQATKATNQIMCAGIIQAVAEAMAFAKAEGLPLERVIDTLAQGAGSSWYFVNRAPYMAKMDFPAGFRVRLHQKDLQICREMAAAHGARLPVVESTLAEYAALIRDGHGDEDISTIYRSKSALFASGDPKRSA